MPKYKVCFKGFAYVEAPDESDAQLAYEEGAAIYSEEEVTEIAEVDEFVVVI